MEKKTQLTFLLENRPGAVAKVARALGKAGVNIEAVSINDGVHHGVLRLVVEDREGARAALRKAKIAFSEEKVHALKLANRPGALAEACALLGEQGINLDFVYGSTCTCGHEPGGAEEGCSCGCEGVLVVSVADAKVASALLSKTNKADESEEKEKKKTKKMKEKTGDKKRRK